MGPLKEEAIIREVQLWQNKKIMRINGKTVTPSKTIPYSAISKITDVIELRVPINIKVAQSAKEIQDLTEEEKQVVEEEPEELEEIKEKETEIKEEEQAIVIEEEDVKELVVEKESTKINEETEAII